MRNPETDAELVRTVTDLPRPVGDSVSVVISAFNEETVIARNLARLREYMETRFPERQWEIILVDDGSVDSTASLVAELAERDPRIRLIRLPKNCGQGKGFRAGIAAAVGDIIVTSDADLSYGTEVIGRLIEKLHGSCADVAAASPFLDGSGMRNVPVHRQLLSHWCNRYLSIAVKNKLSAPTCAVRAYRASLFDKMALSSDGMEINAEIVLKAQILGLTITEIPADLDWHRFCESQKPAGRKSKMRIFQNILQHSFLGAVLSTRVMFAVPLALCLIVFAIYSTSLTWSLVDKMAEFSATGLTFRLALSKAIREVFASYTHAFYAVAATGVCSFGIVSLWFVSRQMKFYFEQSYMLASQILFEMRQARKLSDIDGGLTATNTTEHPRRGIDSQDA